MSTLKADTIVASDGTSPVTLTKQSAAKAWVNFNGTGTIAIRDDFNVSTLGDNGTGDYTVNFSNNMSNADYSGQIAGALTDTGHTSSSTPFSCRSFTASSMRAIGAGTSNQGLDMIRMCVAVHGDLA